MNLRIVIMGVAGCGKSTVGAALAQRLGLPYHDGDDLHSAEAVEKMRAGTALADDDRWPWLDRVAATLNSGAIVIGCSALRRAYRDRIRAGVDGQVHFVHLAGDRELIAARMADRAGHYMPPTLLESQFAALEPPDETGPDAAVRIGIDQPLDAIVASIAARLKGDLP